MQPTYDPAEDWDAGVRAYFEAAFGQEHFARMAAALLRPPLGACLRINPLCTTTQSVIERLPAALGRDDAATSDSAGAQPHTLPDVPGVVILPGSGPHTIDYSATGGKEVVVSRKAGEAVLRGAQPYVPGCVAASAGLEAGDLVAVTVAVEPRGSAAMGITRGTTLQGGAAVPGLPDRQRLHIGLGRAMLSRGDLFSARNGLGVQMLQRVYAHASCDGVLRGEVMLQNLASVVAAQALGPRPGSRVVDMCAAPGGKATALAQLMGDTGTLVALERSANKVPGIRAMAEEFGLTCIQAHRMDSTKAVLRLVAQPACRSSAAPDVPSAAAVSSAAALETAAAAPTDGTAPVANGIQVAGHSGGGHVNGTVTPPAAVDAAAVAVSAVSSAGHPAENQRQRARRERKLAAVRARGLQPPPLLLGAAPEPSIRGFPPESFDAVLLDGPCSGLGLRPRLVHRIPLQELAQAAEQQRRLIDAAVGLLRPGGHMVYSTCTINPGENEANVRYALDAHPSLELVPHKPYIGSAGLIGPCQSAAAVLQNPAPGNALTAPPATAGEEAARLVGRGLSEAEARLVQRFDPAGTRDTPGFFIAKFRKRQ